MKETLQARSILKRPALFPALAALCLGLSLWQGSQDWDLFWRTYLTSALFVLSLQLGCLFFVLAHWACRAAWSDLPRRRAEDVISLLPLSALLFLPLLFQLHHLYPWARAPQHISLGQEKALYLQPLFFQLRSLAYLAFWSALGHWYGRTSPQQDRSASTLARRMQTFSAPALIPFALSLTFAAFDWIMALDEAWYSSIFGVYFFAGCALAGVALLAVLVSLPALAPAGLRSAHRHDLGKLLLGWVCFWAYIAFSQFLLIWYANLPEETGWYHVRLGQDWQWLSTALVAGHFLFPFFFLLPRRHKLLSRPLRRIAAWLILFHYLDLYWLILPSPDMRPFSSPILELALPGSWLFLYWWSLRRRIQKAPPNPPSDLPLGESLQEAPQRPLNPPESSSAF